MKKIPTVFRRDPNNMKRVLPEVSPGCEWVIAGEGVATGKIDGTCMMLDEAPGASLGIPALQGGEEVKPTYIRYVEDCEGEGEKWNFWLPTDGMDGEQVELLAASVSDANPDQNEPTFELLGDEITEPEVDLLVRFADDGYYATHNKVVGRFTVPDDFDQMHEDDKFRFLYKGGIAKFFTTDE